MFSEILRRQRHDHSRRRNGTSNLPVSLLRDRSHKENDGNGDPARDEMVGYATSDYFGNNGRDVTDADGGNSDQRDGVFFKTEDHVTTGSEDTIVLGEPYRLFQH